MTAQKLHRDEALRMAEDELKALEKLGLNVLFYTDKAFPNRLKHAEDSPVLMYTKGKMSLNVPKVIGIVGTRNATEAGVAATEKLVRELKPHNPLIVSGLAYGIDTVAHRAAVENGLQTTAVLGNSLDRIYPATNKSLAHKMLENGGLISEFETGTKPDRENFPQRNRIVAGMVDALVVVETAVKGGSMITADLAHGYNRDVFAFPGRVSDKFSSGCNFLIKSNKAALIEDVKDIEYQLNWDAEKKNKAVQKQLFQELAPEEKVIFDQLNGQDKVSLDLISVSSGMSVSKTSTLLLEMEFKGLVKSLPGKHYALT